MNKMLDKNYLMIKSLGEDISNFKDIVETKEVLGYAMVLTYKEKTGHKNASYGLRGDPNDLLNTLTLGIAEYIALQQFEYLGTKQ